MSYQTLDLLVLGHTVIEPFNTAKVLPRGYALSLDSALSVVKEGEPIQGPIDLRRHDPTTLLSPLEMTGRGFVLAPGRAVIARSAETIHCPASHEIRVDRHGRFAGMFIAIATFGTQPHGGSSGRVQLELVNHSPWSVILWPGMPIAEVCFRRLPPAA